MQLSRLPSLAAALTAGAIAAGGAPATAQERTDPAAALGVAVDRDQPVALVADEVLYDENAGTVTARGAVEVYYGPRTLTADEIVYDSRTGRIAATGPITLRGEEGSTVFADAADLDAELRDGIVEGARAVIAGGAAQLAAVEGRRIDGRYNALNKVVYSSCAVCPESPTPLWSIRARRAVHDEVERVVHFEDAVFEAWGVPVGYLPYFTFPDPTVERRSGFLPPSFLASSNFGYAVKVPYFIAIDESRDATITPFPTTRDGPILEGEYRQRFDFGGFDASGSGGWIENENDDGRELRGHLFTDGAFDVARLGLGSGAVAGWDVAVASDKGYPGRYDFTDEDRFESELFVERYGLRDFFDVSALMFQTLRENEDQDQIPFALPRFEIRRVFDEGLAGGELGIEASGAQLVRDVGGDLGRISFQTDWERSEALDEGVLLRAFALARADFYNVQNYDDFANGNPVRLAPLAGIEARYPLISPQAAGSHLLEPIAQFITAPNDVNPDDIPNEDSTIVEFDDTNLFDDDRFPGEDLFESGTRINAGLRYAWISDSPLDFDITAGRVFRLSKETAFSEGTGLSDQRSDLVAAWTLGWSPYATVRNRLQFGDDMGVNSNEIGAEFDVGRARLDAAYVFLKEDATAGAEDDREEAAVGAELDLTRNWTIGGFARRDLVEADYINVAGTLGFENECAALEFYLARDFTNSEDDPASTSFGLRIRLFGSADGRGARSGVCGLRPAP